jgi:hypothetical protein
MLVAFETPSASLWRDIQRPTSNAPVDLGLSHGFISGYWSSAITMRKDCLLIISRSRVKITPQPFLGGATGSALLALIDAVLDIASTWFLRYFIPALAIF